MPRPDAGKTGSEGESGDRMDHYVKHLLLPLLAPLAVVALYFTPKETYGCANRGLMAFAVVLAAAVGALAATIRGSAEHRRGNDHYVWWLVTTLVLLLPMVLLLGPLG